MGTYARFEHYSTTLEVETCPEFWPPSPVSGPLCRAGPERPGTPRNAPPSRSTRALFIGTWGIYSPWAPPRSVTAAARGAVDLQQAVRLKYSKDPPYLFSGELKIRNEVVDLDAIFT